MSSLQAGSPAPVPSLATSATATLAASVAYGACQWLLFPLAARAGSAVGLGQLSVAIAITTPIFLLSMLQLRAVYVADARRNHGGGSYVALRLLGLFMALLLSLVVAIVGTRDTVIVHLVLGLSAFRFAEGISDLLYGVWQAAERLVWVALALTVHGVLSVMAFGLALFLQFDLVEAMAAMAFVALAWLGAELWFGRARGSGLPAPNRRRGEMLSLLRHAFPLGLAGALLALNTNIPRLLLFTVKGPAEVGGFSALHQLTLAGSVAIAAVGQAAAARLARYFKDDVRRYEALSRRLAINGLIWGSVLASGAAIGGHALLGSLYGAAYSWLSTDLVWMCVAMLPAYAASGLGYAVNAAGIFAPQVRVYLTTVACTLLLGLLLIPRSGLKGAIIATGGGAAVSLALLGYLFAAACRAQARRAVQDARV